jgi:2,4-dienoyl-CoA reductase-like NADH-dependent reductase (Old Yellow Enzyme family)/thioredoxin reductase
MNGKYTNLLQPLELRGHVIKNRMVSANSLPHFLQGPEKYPADSIITHYANRAKSGAAIVTCMGINDFNADKHCPMEVDGGHFPDFDLYNPQCQNYLLQLSDAIHFYGAKACMGFFIASSKYPILRKKHPMDEGTLEFVQLNNPMGPFPGSTPEQIEEFYEGVRASVAALGEETMNKVAESYAQQCKILKFLGFDMASIHLCYRGQMPTRFLSPLTNHRTDEYGGCVENRARFPLMILQRIREEVGKDFIIEILISGEEDDQGGYTLDDTVAFLRLAEPYVDIAQIRASNADPNHPTGFNLEETPFLRQAEYIKKAGVKMLIAGIGGWHNPETAEKELTEGKLDLISMARAWVSNPDYGKLVYEDRADDITPCLRCNKCHGRGPNDPFVSVCSVNPKIGIEHRLHHLVSAPEGVKKVAVVGGGPAGMKAAIDLCDRGHKVTLYEITDSLGGAIKHADFIDFKWPLRDFKNYLIHQVEKRDITVKLNTLAMDKVIKDEGFDAVVVAAGAHPMKPNIPGLDGKNVVFAMDSIMNPDALGKHVVVIGGGEVGVEAGMNLAKKGHVVTVLEMRDQLAADSTFIHYRSMFQDAWEAIPDFHAIVNARCTKVTEDAVYYTDSDCVEHSIPADSIVVSAGMKPLRQEAMSFYESAPRFYMIGDCCAPSTVQQAMRSAFATASQI